MNQYFHGTIITLSNIGIKNRQPVTFYYCKDFFIVNRYCYSHKLKNPRMKYEEMQGR